MDEKLKDFNFQEFLYILFPFSMFFKRKQKETSKNLVYDIKRGNPISIKSEKILGQIEKLYGDKLQEGYALDLIKMGIKREICDEILRSDLFEWQIDETPMGSRISARIIVNKFSN